MWRRDEPALDRETVDGIIRMLMQINSKLDFVVDLLGGADAEEDES